MMFCIYQFTHCALIKVALSVSHFNEAKSPVYDSPPQTVSVSLFYDCVCMGAVMISLCIVVGAVALVVAAVCWIR